MDRKQSPLTLGLMAAATEDVMGFPVCREEVEEEGVNQAPAGTQHSPSAPHTSQEVIFTLPLSNPPLCGSEEQVLLFTDAGRKA